MIGKVKINAKSALPPKLTLKITIASTAKAFGKKFIK
jgi:hypothetical protein